MNLLDLIFFLATTLCGLASLTVFVIAYRRYRTSTNVKRVKIQAGELQELSEPHSEPSATFRRVKREAKRARTQAEKANADVLAAFEQAMMEVKLMPTDAARQAIDDNYWTQSGTKGTTVAAIAEWERIVAEAQLGTAEEAHRHLLKTISQYSNVRIMLHNPPETKVPRLELTQEDIERWLRGASRNQQIA